MSPDRIRRHPGDTGNPLRGIGLHMFGQPVEPNRPVGHKIPVVKPLRDHDVHHAEGEGAIRSRPDPGMDVGLFGQRDDPRIDDDQLPAVFQHLADRPAVGRPVLVGVLSPDDLAAGLAGIILADDPSHGQPMGNGPGPKAEAADIREVGRPVEMGEPLHHGLGVAGIPGITGRHHQGLGSVLFPHLLQAVRNQGEGLIP